MIPLYEGSASLGILGQNHDVTIVVGSQGTLARVLIETGLPGIGTLGFEISHEDAEVLNKIANDEVKKEVINPFCSRETYSPEKAKRMRLILTSGNPVFIQAGEQYLNTSFSMEQTEFQELCKEVLAYLSFMPSHP
ncbi:MAG: hypothetical protein AAB632_01125 [Patescibacteria group bacterium]